MSLSQPQSTKPERSASGYDLRPLSPAERERYAAPLNAEERRVLLNQGTEPPFCGLLLKNKEAGIYACKLCGLPLFNSENKFESGTGWPSFYQGYDPDHIREIVDKSHGMIRVEIRCARCDGHLGHVFDDGPPPTYKRYCLNSVSMDFYPQGKEPAQKVAGKG
ncbi:MAG: peptide-methionine (R)-S-oxide reductase MsrB [Steroidobacteraceae bacterium]